MRSKRRKIIDIYYHRFEIEESFKDLKHIQALEQAQLTKPQSLKVLLWFSILAFILAYLAGWLLSPVRARHPKKCLSWFRQFFEALQRETLGPPGHLITGGL